MKPTTIHSLFTIVVTNNWDYENLISIIPSLMTHFIRKFLCLNHLGSPMSTFQLRCANSERLFRGSNKPIRLRIMKLNKSPNLQMLIGQCSFIINPQPLFTSLGMWMISFSLIQMLLILMFFFSKVWAHVLLDKSWSFILFSWS